MEFVKKCVTFLGIIFFSFTVSEANSIKQFSQSKYCIGCHKEQIDSWNTTWHSKSHMEKNPLYKKTVEYIAKNEQKEVNEIAVNCARCHNPRIMVKKVSKAYIVASALGFYKSKEVKKVDDDINSDQAKEGINCIVCHQVDKIHSSKDVYNKGYESIKWAKKDVIIGGFETSRNSYHKTQKREHFGENSDNLCLVCHKGAENKNGVALYQTGIEYEENKNNKKCVDCHMGKQKSAIIAPDVQKETIENRIIRDHTFAGVRNSDIVKLALKLQLKKVKKRLVVSLTNKTPHKVPTGYGERELIVEVIFKNRKNRVLKRYNNKINSIYVDEEGKVTLSYLSTRLKSDTRIEPNETSTFSFPITRKMRRGFVEVKVWYKLVREDIVKMINLNDNIFTKRNLKE